MCGRFEGVDERLVAARRLEEVSIGDYVLSGGEIAALALLDACVRLIPGIMGRDASGDDESFEAGLLEYPHYTRPREFEEETSDPRRAAVGRPRPHRALARRGSGAGSPARAGRTCCASRRRPDVCRQLGQNGIMPRSSARSVNQAAAISATAPEMPGMTRRG